MRGAPVREDGLTNILRAYGTDFVPQRDGSDTFNLYESRSR